MENDESERIIQNVKRRDYHRKNRLKIIDYYSKGTNKCNQCGNSDLRVLSIDHINGNGSAHRKELIRQGMDLKTWIIRNPIPI